MNMKKWIIGSIVAIVIIVVAIFFLWMTYPMGKEKRVSPEANAAIALERLRDSLRNANQYSELQDSIEKLNILLDDCRGRKKPVVAPVRAKPAPVRTIPAPAPPAQVAPQIVEKAPAPAPAPVKSSPVTPKKAQDKYAPNFSGDYGVTINEYMQVVYFISNDLLNAGESQPTLPAPLLRQGSPGTEFEYDKNLGYWVYTSGEVVEEAVLINGYTKIWNVYIGQNSQWDYPMFLPHELAKVGSKAVREGVKMGQMVQHSKDEGWDWHTKMSFLTR